MLKTKIKEVLIALLNKLAKKKKLHISIAIWWPLNISLLHKNLCTRSIAKEGYVTVAVLAPGKEVRLNNISRKIST